MEGKGSNSPPPVDREDGADQEGDVGVITKHMRSLEVGPSRTSRAVKCAVIDEDLIIKAVKHEQEQEEDKVPGFERTIDLPNLTTLVLSFQNILRIENLRGFEKLTKLQLDNNVIEKIENLETLVNLKWLDLSFNNITKIEGLDTLTQLTDLSLFDNKIENIENLSALKQLEVLSIGNNRIKDTEQVKTLRKFKKLRVLNLKGCPVASEEDYHVVTFAYLSTLKYLDYQRIEPSQVQKARDRLLDQLVELEEEEKLEEAREKEEALQAEEDARYAAANLAGIKDLFNFLLKSDSEFPRLQQLPGYGQIIEDYRMMFERCTANLVEKIMVIHQEKEAEKKEFQAALDGVTTKRDTISIDHIQKFESSKKQALSLYMESIRCHQPEPQILEDLRDTVDMLSDTLMENEMLLTEQTASLISEFEDNYKVLTDRAVNVFQSIFRELEDVTNSYAEALNALVENLINKYHDDELDDMPEVAGLVGDRDSIKNSVTTSHDNHMTKVVQKADELNEREDKDAKAMIEGLKKKEYERNRHRVSEIVDMADADAAIIDRKLREDEDSDN